MAMPNYENYLRKLMALENRARLMVNFSNELDKNLIAAVDKIIGQTMCGTKNYDELYSLLKSIKEDAQNIIGNEWNRVTD